MTVLVWESDIADDNPKMAKCFDSSKMAEKAALLAEGNIQL